jgi:hypothetical protein
VAEFTARIWDTTIVFPDLLTATGRIIHSPLSGRSIALGMLLPALGTTLHGFTNDLAVLDALGTVLTNGDTDSLSSITSHLQGLTLPGTGPAGIPVVPPANQAANVADQLPDGAANAASPAEFVRCRKAAFQQLLSSILQQRWTNYIAQDSSAPPLCFPHLVHVLGPHIPVSAADLDHLATILQIVWNPTPGCAALSYFDKARVLENKCAELRLPHSDYFFPSSAGADQVWELLGEHLPPVPQTLVQGKPTLVPPQSKLVNTEGGSCTTGHSWSHIPEGHVTQEDHDRANQPANPPRPENVVLGVDDSSIPKALSEYFYAGRIIEGLSAVLEAGPDATTTSPFLACG